MSISIHNILGIHENLLINSENLYMGKQSHQMEKPSSRSDSLPSCTVILNYFVKSFNSISLSFTREFHVMPSLIYQQALYLN